MTGAMAVSCYLNWCRGGSKTLTALLGVLLTTYYINLWTIICNIYYIGDRQYQHYSHIKRDPDRTLSEGALGAQRHLQAVPRPAAVAVVDAARVRPTNRPSPRNKTLVYVTAYMHGGSSILGSIFEKNPSATYLYEPLDAVYTSVFNTVRYLWPYTYISRPDSTYRERTPFEEEMVGYYLDAMTACDFRRLPEVISEHAYFSGEASCVTSCDVQTQVPPPLRSFWESMLKNATMRHKQCPSESIIAFDGYCNPSKMIYRCKSNGIIAMKLLRYDLKELESRLERFPDMYVIHVVRDPRGIINSHTKEGVAVQRLQLTARALCNAMERDLQVIRALQSHYPNRLEVVMYEDFAKNPKGVTTQLYRFIERYLPGDVIRWVNYSTRNKKDDGKYIRRNATDTAFQWRRSMDPQLRAYVESHCSRLLEVAGYKADNYI